MAKVTYLLGAGASYNALPIVEEIPEAVSQVIEYLQNETNKPIIVQRHNIEEESIYKKHLNVAIDYLTLMKKGSEEHLSIDTYAKMLYLTRNDDYENIKATISLFFELYQLLIEQNLIETKKVLLDKRYDAFFASILQDSFDDFPKGIKILTYNYDHQIVDTYKKYLNSAQSNSSARSLLNLYQRKESVRNYTVDASNFAILKLHGTAAFLKKRSRITHLYNRNNSTNKIRECIVNFSELISDQECESAISFAWEIDIENEDFFTVVRRSLMLTEYLVVIGYSFPFFNRLIDSQLITKDLMDYLKKIYIQDKKPEEIIDRVRAIRDDIEIIPVHNTDQFYLPNELTL